LLDGSLQCKPFGFRVFSPFTSGGMLSWKAVQMTPGATQFYADVEISQLKRQCASIGGSNRLTAH
jgi:monoamine oxidase